MIFISSRADRYLLGPIAAKLGTDDPRYLVVLGDRRETMQAAWEAFQKDTPVVHIQGGERTPYSLDDVHRDCITRISSLHFPPTLEAANRIYQINPAAVVIPCGAIGAELAANTVPIPRTDLDFSSVASPPDPSDKTWLVTWHPQPGEDVQELISSLKEEGGEVIWTFPNKDPGYQEVIHKIYQAGFHAQIELGMPVYLSLMHYVTAVVGNSSSGMIEAPSIGAQTINIGNRQRGRPQATSVTSIACKRAEIEAALHLTHYMPVFPKANPYYRPGTIDTIVREIRARYG